MTIIDHLSLGVPDLPAGRRFYDSLLESLGYACLAATEAFAAYGDGAIQFLIMTPLDREAASAGNGAHVCFVAPSPEAVDAFHRIALAGGGTDEGAPGPRPGYPKPGVYTAFVRDPFGNKLEAIHNGFAA